jgi:hypothetical protein
MPAPTLSRAATHRLPRRPFNFLSIQSRRAARIISRPPFLFCDQFSGKSPSLGQPPLRSRLLHYFDGGATGHGSAGHRFAVGIYRSSGGWRINYDSRERFSFGNQSHHRRLSNCRNFYRHEYRRGHLASTVSRRAADCSDQHQGRNHFAGRRAHRKLTSNLSSASSSNELKLELTPKGALTWKLAN